MLCDDLERRDTGGRDAQEGRDRRILVADSLHCTAETIKTL